MAEIEYLECKETAALLRAALKAAFPGVKFSVRSDVYAGGASIDVYWTDGPTDAEVDPTCQRYAGATFDGQQDIKNYHTSMISNPDGTVREVHHGADFVFTHRSLSAEFLAELEATAAQILGEPVKPNGWYDWIDTPHRPFRDGNGRELLAHLGRYQARPLPAPTSAKKRTR